MNYTIAEHVTWKPLAAGAVVLDLKSSNYYTLNETAAFIWRRIFETKSDDALVPEMLAAFDIEEAVLIQDISSVLAFLREENLLALDQAEAPAPRKTKGGSR